MAKMVSHNCQSMLMALVLVSIRHYTGNGILLVFTVRYCTEDAEYLYFGDVSGIVSHIRRAIMN